MWWIQELLSTALSLAWAASDRYERLKRWKAYYGWDSPKPDGRDVIQETYCMIVLYGAGLFLKKRVTTTKPAYGCKCRQNKWSLNEIFTCRNLKIKYTNKIFIEAKKIK